MPVQLEAMIAEYVELAAELRRKVPALGAIMGNNSDVTHPGHRAFYDAVSGWVTDFSKTGPSRESLLQAMELLLFSAKTYENTTACWYLLAIQSHAGALLPLLEEADRAALCRRYETAYPRGKRLPVQQELYELLGGKTRRKFRFCKSN